MEKQNIRIDGVDIAKGIGILLVYIGHVPPTNEIRCYIYAFHMPLFFYLSGVFLNEKRRNLLEFILNKVKSLLIPLLTFMCFSIVVGWICDGNFRSLHMGINSALWFLPVLFLSEIISYVVCMQFKTFHSRLSSCLCFAVVALIIDNLSIKLPFAFHSVPLASIFLLLGKITSENVLSFLRLSNELSHIRVFFICILSCLCIFTFVIFSPQCTNMHNAHLAYGPLGGGIAMIGIIQILSLSRLFEGISLIKTILINVGKNSITIFGLHLTIINAFGLSIETFKDSIYNYLILNLLIIGILFLFVKIINRWCPFLIGRF